MLGLLYIYPVVYNNPNTFAGVGGEGAKKLSPEGSEGGEKSARSAPAGPGARTWDLPRARRGSPAARQGGCLDKPFRAYR